MSSFLWLTWKDHAHPTAGGAEVVLNELSHRLVADGHEVTWLTAAYGKATKFDEHDGINIIRVGESRYVQPFQALAYYARNLRNKYDFVIEVVNTSPYFSVFFGKKSKRFLFYHQMAREVWHHETKPPLSYTGYYVFEPVASRLLSASKVPVITVSQSTSDDLKKFGFDPDRTHVISEGIELDPLPRPDAAQKFKRPTLISLGAMRSMKRTIDQVKAFEIAKIDIPNLQLKIAGSTDGDYGQKVLHYIDKSLAKEDIKVYGKVSTVEKIRLLQRSHILLQTSIKEGWGLTVTEAASQGTPAVAYNVDGLRDSIKDGQTGIVTDQNPAALAAGIKKLLVSEKFYDKIRDNAWKASKKVTFDQSYKDFKKALELA
ncbi:MAG TPA: glycosyltransferase family 4 protein [Candidatus Saccharimonadales bacterium]|nr:glycosyltransferase family 4 protein [Candidatus Saccharimonadales bacterium]